MSNRRRERCVSPIAETEQLERLKKVRRQEHGGRMVWMFNELCAALRVDPKKAWVRQTVPTGQMIAIKRFDVNVIKVKYTVNPAESWVTEDGLEAMVSAFAMCSQSRAMEILKCAEA